MKTKSMTKEQALELIKAELLADDYFLERTTRVADVGLVSGEELIAFLDSEIIAEKEKEEDKLFMYYDNDCSEPKFLYLNKDQRKLLDFIFENIDDTYLGFTCMGDIQPEWGFEKRK